MQQVIKNCYCALYADDTVVYITGKHHELLVNNLQSDLQGIESWLVANKLHVNATKCKILMISTPQNVNYHNPISVTINGSVLEQVNEYKYLGYWLDSHLNFNFCVDKMLTKMRSCIGLIKHLPRILTKTQATHLLKGLVILIIDYGDVLYSNTSAINLSAIQVALNKMCRIILRTDRRTSLHVICNEMKLMTLSRRSHYH